MPPKSISDKAKSPKEKCLGSKPPISDKATPKSNKTTTPTLKKSTITYQTSKSGKVTKDQGSSSALVKQDPKDSPPKPSKKISTNPTRAPGKQAQLPDGRYIVIDEKKNKAYVRNDAKPGVQRQSGGVTFKIGKN